MLNEKVWIKFIKQNGKHQSFLEELDVKITLYVPYSKNGNHVINYIKLQNEHASLPKCKW